MSNHTPIEAPPTTDAPALEPLVCEYCGMPINEDDQRCAALHDGRCRQ